MDIERELQRLIDIEAIRNQIARYGHLADSEDSEGYGALFAQDGVLDVFGTPYNGRAAITGLHAENVPARKASGVGQGHITVNSVIEVDGDTATARSYMGGAAIQYQDQWRRIGGAWLIQRRVILGGPSRPAG